MTYIRYIDKAAAYYKAAGYDKSYAWAEFEEVPFTALKKPLSECRVALISTSEVAYKAGDAPDTHLVMMEGGVYTIPADTPADNLYSPSEVHDVHATDLGDVNSFFPITRLHELAAAGKIRDVAPFTWSKGDAWKGLVFTEEQPYLEGEVAEEWGEAMERYQAVKDSGGY